MEEYNIDDDDDDCYYYYFFIKKKREDYLALLLLLLALCAPYLMEEIKDYPPRLGDSLSNAI